MMIKKYFRLIITYLSGTFIFLFIGFIVGWAIGIILGVFGSMLFAPQSGAETRENIKEKAKEIKDKAVQSGKETIERTKEIAREARQAAQDKTEELTKKYRIPE